jgi:hypothetical protein
VRRKQRAGLRWPLPATLFDDEFEALLFPAPPQVEGQRPEPGARCAANVERITVDPRRYLTTLLSSFTRNRCPACRKICVLRVKCLSSLPRNRRRAWREISTAAH